MKKVLVIALAALATAAFATTPAKKDKKQKNVAVATTAKEPVHLLSTSDSLSYAAGVYATDGLEAYMRESGIDSTNISDFVEGLKAGLAHNVDKKQMARLAGMQIAQSVETRVYPRISSQVKESSLTIDSLTFNRGFIDAVTCDTAVMKQRDASHYFTTTMQAAEERASAQYKLDNETWLKQNATKAGVKTLPSGLQYKVITEGKGDVATKDDNVTVRYEGKLIDGTVFDSSYKRNPNTTSFRPDQVIKGWTEALCMMPVGSKWELYIPQNLAYGARPAGPIKPYSTLIFTVEVVKVEKAAEKKDTIPATKLTPAKKVQAKKTTKKK